MRSKIIFAVLIFLLTFILRIYRLGEIPSGFYSDESLYGYEAYSILKTGKDEYGSKFPIVFKAFGDFRPGLFIYATVPFVALGGLTEFATRLPSAFFSGLTALIIFFLALEIWNNFSVALLSTFLFSVSPWSLQFARMSHETNLATFLVTAGIYFFIKGLKKGWFLLVSFLIFSLSIYAYYTTRVFVPLWLVSVIFVYRKHLYSKFKYLILGLIFIFILSLPLLKVLSNKETGWSRVDAVSIWGDPGIVLKINELRGEDKIAGDQVSKIFHNKVIDGTIALGKSFLSHFDPQFLFFQGDPQKLYQTPNIGIILPLEFIFIIIAIANLRKRKNPYIFILLSWAILGLLPDTLTRFYPAAPRIHLVLPLIGLIAGYGIQSSVVAIKPKGGFGYKLLVGVLLFMTFFQLAYFLHQNFVHVQIRYALEWHYGLRDLTAQIKSREAEYDQIWISKECWGWINYLFYLKYPPEKIQKEIKLSAKNEFGLGWVYGFGKYKFDDFPANMFSLNKTLFIGVPRNFSSFLKKPLYTVYYPNGQIAFYLADKTSF